MADRCPTCGSEDPGQLFAQIDRGRAYDAGITGCMDPFHDPPNVPSCGCLTPGSCYGACKGRPASQGPRRWLHCANGCEFEYEDGSVCGKCCCPLHEVIEASAYEQLEAERDAARAMYANAERRQTEAEKEMENLTTEHAFSLRQLERAEKERDELEQQLNASIGETVSARRERDDYLARLKATSDEANRAKNERYEARAELEEFKRNGPIGTPHAVAAAERRISRLREGITDEIECYLDGSFGQEARWLAEKVRSLLRDTEDADAKD